MINSLSRGAAFVVFMLAANSAAAQQLAITVPGNGTRVTPGETITVQVSAPANTFQAVQVIGQHLGITPALQTPPYVFSLTIPNDIIGPITLTAVGQAVGTNAVFSTPIQVDSETSAAVTTLATNLRLLELQYVGQQAHLRVTGTFNDGATLHLTGSSLISYVSANAGVATVDSTGLVAATGAGKTTVTVSYGTQSIQVQVSVLSTVRGDLNGDDKVDTTDLNILNAALNSPANGANDARDLNHDGVINGLDANILKSLCTYSLCSTGAPCTGNCSTVNACDVNFQGIVNITDMQTIINEALGVMSPINDLNRDGVVNVVDIQRVTNAALGQGCS